MTEYCEPEGASARVIASCFSRSQLRSWPVGSGTASTAEIRLHGLHVVSGGLQVGAFPLEDICQCLDLAVKPRRQRGGFRRPAERGIPLSGGRQLFVEQRRKLPYPIDRCPQHAVASIIRLGTKSVQWAK